MDNFDIFSQICIYLNDREKTNLAAITMITNAFKYRLRYIDRIDERKIRNLSFYDNFESILIYYVHERFPKNVRSAYINCYPGCTIFTSSSDFNIPTTITHLIF